MELNFNLGFKGTSVEHKAVEADTSVLYEAAIIGGGPAALTAAVYLMRKGINTLLVTKSFGGQVAETKEIENYLGFKYIQGHELVSKFTDQVKQFEIAIAEGFSVSSIHPLGRKKEIILSDGRVLKAKTLIICAGSTWKQLGVKGENKFKGRGVAYCSTCDAPFFADKDVFVVGGGNSGAEAALDLLKVAKHITIVEIDKNLKADKILIDKIKEYKNYKIITSNRVAEIKGGERVESIVLQNIETGDTQELKTDGVFVEIGMVPNNSFIKDGLHLNQYGEIIIDFACKTNIPGVFAAGDITSVPFKQIVIAAGEGSKAALSASDFLMKTD
jgi:alkyl hydroperoxide reductase subunit F